jgi:epoxyqueuosine reductase
MGDELAALLTAAIRERVLAAGTDTRYREPLVAFADALDPRFGGLRDHVDPDHMLPADLLPGARSVVSFFIPFAPDVPEANGRDRHEVAQEWVVAYVETNALIDRITASLIESLADQGVRAAAEPATYNFDETTLVSRWSHKSAAVIAGLGSFGLHHLLITDAGCAGRLGSLVLDRDLPIQAGPPRERCLFFHDRSCLECVMACPAGALDQGGEIDKQACWERCQQVGQLWSAAGRADVCGKCATGPCSIQSAVRTV